MHTWWRGNWEGADKVNPPGTHQQQVQQRCQRCRVQETYMQESQTADSAATQAAYRVTSKQAQAVGTSIITKGTPRRKRTVQQIDAEEQADRAATEIVDLVEQEAQRTAGSRTDSSTSVDMHQSSQGTWALRRGRNPLNKRRRGVSQSG